jgi:hypothetical protein
MAMGQLVVQILVSPDLWTKGNWILLLYEFQAVCALVLEKNSCGVQISSSKQMMCLYKKDKWKKE